MKTESSTTVPINSLAHKIRQGNRAVLDSTPLKQAVFHLWSKLSSQLEKEYFQVDPQKLVSPLPESTLSETEKLHAESSFNAYSENRKIHFSRIKKLRNSAGNTLFYHLLERATSSVNFKNLSKLRKSNLISELTHFF